MLQIDTDFPGGNGIVHAIDGDRIRFEPDNRDSMQDWFYWAIRLSGAAGRRVTLQFVRPHCVSAAGIACSVDDGRSWSWCTDCEREGECWSVGVPGDPCLLSMGMPYTLADWWRFAAHWSGHGRWRGWTLVETPTGRPVPALRIGSPDAAHRFLITARHHCCEMMASYAVEGLVRAALQAPENCAWWILPFMDLDGSELGDQGKARAPHDHNRDYGDDSRYAETAALRRATPTWGPFTAALDLHCPWIEGHWNERIYLVGSQDQAIATEQRRFWSLVAERSRSSPLLIDAESDYLPYGQDWNVAASYGGYRTCSRWAAEELQVALAGTVEISYGQVHDRSIDQGSARNFGALLATALVAYAEGLR